MVLFRITENEPSKMHNVRPYVYSRPWFTVLSTNLPYTLDFYMQRLDFGKYAKIINHAESRDIKAYEALHFFFIYKQLDSDRALKVA